MKVDVVVVGARCAGAATALLLARAGARVVVVDRARYGTDTLSTHALMRGAVLQLHRWGVLPSIVEAGVPPVTATTFDYGDDTITVPIEPKHGVPALYAPRRTLLDGLLSAVAVESGAEVVYGVTVDGLLTGPSGRVRGVTAAASGKRLDIHADVVIGADGLYSTIARRVGAEPILTGTHAAGVLYSYWKDVEARDYRWIFRPNGSVGTIPTNGGTCVFVSIPAPQFRQEVRGEAGASYRRLLREVCPEFADHLEGATQLEAVHGFGGHPGFIKKSSGPGWALVGDAGYFKDPATAHGITDALRDAELLAHAVNAGSSQAFEQFEATRLELSRRLFEITDEIASFEACTRRLQMLHREFSREMSREVQHLASLAPLSPWTVPVRENGLARPFESRASV
jgi:2-polyprenyl-6-methoxyphenol hydroxylase-like FAD-dependent oxidoreductase